MTTYRIVRTGYDSFGLLNCGTEAIDHDGFLSVQAAREMYDLHFGASNDHTLERSTPR